jgi:hypothetical protein
MDNAHDSDDMQDSDAEDQQEGTWQLSILLLLEPHVPLLHAAPQALPRMMRFPLNLLEALAARIPEAEGLRARHAPHSNESLLTHLQRKCVFSCTTSWTSSFCPKLDAL